MALSLAKPDSLPNDAVVITEDQALRYQWKIITAWDKLGDV